MYRSRLAPSPLLAGVDRVGCGHGQPQVPTSRSEGGGTGAENTVAHVGVDSGSKFG